MSNGGPTGSIADLLNNVFEINSDAINTFSSVVGTVADASGVVGAAIAAVDFASQQLRNKPDPLQPILAALQNDFAQMYAALEASFNEQRWTELAKEISGAESELQILDGLVNAQPPLNDDQRLGHIGKCLDPLIALSDGTTHSPSPFF